MTIIRTAAIQMNVLPDKFKNIDNLRKYLDTIARENVDLVILPEMFTCPYQTYNFPLYAEEEGGPSWQKVSSLAAEYKIYLAAGSMPEKDEQNKTYNTAYVFNRKGKQIGKHRKAHLFNIDVLGGQKFRESDTLSPGNKVTVFQTEFTPIGLSSIS